MDIKDRGMKKWHGFMMPEHIGDLKEMYEDYEKEKKPSLDEYQLRELDEKLLTAVEYRLPLLFTTWQNGFFDEIEGVVQKIDDINKFVWVAELNGDLRKVKYENITDVEFV